MGFHLLDLFKPSTWQYFLSNYFSTNLIINIIDILVVWFVIYKLIMLLNGTKAIQVFKGIAIIIIVRIISDFIGLSTVSWLMSQVITYGAIAAIVIFQPEVRRGLEHLGRGSILKNIKRQTDHKNKLIIELDDAIQYMSKRKIGALICIENRDSLVDYVETGISLDSDISSQLLINIFIPNTPLHDGAVIIQDEKIASASSYLPLSESSLIPKEYGTRHRAAIGLSEVSDALTIIVSEETGDVSITHSNKFMPHLEQDEYIKILNDELIQKIEENKQNIFYQFIEDAKKNFRGGKK
ncbi:diadenylate cyclase CdaA [Vagococcus carniphilus]|uniref:Diadenylate cyclase n=1 Tax=Vagococcus carniphilus TaxID=218144 RepID=A0AAW8U356_9ENTE|nr:diadenylate cyclase CdaA [Vagococcus carniphilus]MDT2829452.1 diadenylate cyclase CdaA [Vagococcus carniphilus]MDT2833206.1 diadenylate cyclase CdaA [Vagococcus carniphilus]MDT2838911.1 diadenylate cyclase CdaA [Vagococcus carniphilus]MDT2852969.1 diadenylate cyclase CdaA [Vagococcus carniphilus]